MKYLILGGSGFIGKNLIEAVIQAGHDVINYDLAEYDFDNKKIVTILGNFNELEKVEKILSENKIDIVINLITTILPGDVNDIDIEIDAINYNVNNKIRLIEILNKYKIDKYVFISSGGAVYGDNKKQINSENEITNPVNTYGMIKVFLEKITIMKSYNKNFKYMIIRPSNPYGKYQNYFGKQGIIAVAFGKILKDETLDIWGTGDIVRDYIYINDLVSKIMILIDNQVWNEVINIGTGVGISVNDMLGLCERVTGKKLKRNYISARKSDYDLNILDVSKLDKLITNNNFVSINDGLKRTWEWIQGHYYNI